MPERICPRCENAVPAEEQICLICQLHLPAHAGEEERKAKAPKAGKHQTLQDLPSQAQAEGKAAPSFLRRALPWCLALLSLVSMFYIVHLFSITYQLYRFSFHAVALAALLSAFFPFPVWLRRRWLSTSSARFTRKVLYPILLHWCSAVLVVLFIHYVFYETDENVLGFIAGTLIYLLLQSPLLLNQPT